MSTTLQEELYRIGLAPEGEPEQQPPLTLEEMIASLSNEQLESRLQTAAAQIRPDHDYEYSQPRMGRLRGAGASFIVLNRENRALRAVSLPSVANALAGEGRQVVDISRLSYWQRRLLTNTLATKLSTSSHSESVEIPLPAPPRQKEPQASDVVSEILTEIRIKVEKLKLPPDRHQELLAQALLTAVMDREAALDLIREVEYTLYTAVYDNIAESIVAEFPTAEQAAAYVEANNEVMRLPNGKLSGKYRLRTTKP